MVPIRYRKKYGPENPIQTATSGPSSGGSTSYGKRPRDDEEEDVLRIDDMEGTRNKVTSSETKISSPSFSKKKEEHITDSSRPSSVENSFSENKNEKNDSFFKKKREENFENNSLSARWKKIASSSYNNDNNIKDKNDKSNSTSKIQQEPKINQNEKNIHNQKINEQEAIQEKEIILKEKDLKNNQTLETIWKWTQKKDSNNK